MVATTKFIGDCRNGRTETKNTREAAIKSKQRQKSESIADMEKLSWKRTSNTPDTTKKLTREKTVQMIMPATTSTPDTLDRSSNHAEVIDRQDKQYSADQESTLAGSRRDQQSSMLQPEQQCKRRRVSSRTTSAVHTEPPTWRLDTEPTTETARLEPSRHRRRW